MMFAVEEMGNQKNSSGGKNFFSDKKWFQKFFCFFKIVPSKIDKPIKNTMVLDNKFLSKSFKYSTAY